MTDDFLVRAFLGGAAVAVVAGPLGCFVVWRRMAYFGATLSHSALLGVALGFLLGVHPTAGIVFTCVATALALAALERRRQLALDTLLGVLAHVSLAAGLVLIAFLQTLRVDLMGYLFGDVLAIGRGELWLVVAVAAVTLALLARLWRGLLAITINEDLAAVEGVDVARSRLLFVVLLAVVVAVGMKVVGMLLIVSMLIVPAAAARRFARSPEAMAAGAAVVGVLAVGLGLAGSVAWDVPAGPAIVLVAAALFALTLLPAPAGAGRRARGRVA